MIFYCHCAQKTYFRGVFTADFALPCIPLPLRVPDPAGRSCEVPIPAFFLAVLFRQPHQSMPGSVRNKDFMI